MTDAPSSAVSFRNVSRLYGEVRAADDLSFDIEDGEFFALLGPSGSGKTTCLRLIAGFEQPTAGDILIKGRSVIRTAPNKRPVNMVFQHLALFPHLSAAANIEYGLSRQTPAERRRRTAAIADSFHIAHLLGQRPAAISGGERQRVGLARALVTDPNVLLLDEPLSALDHATQSRIIADLRAWYDMWARPAWRVAVSPSAP